MSLGDGLMVLELGLLGWIIFQGELLLHHDRERLRMEREQYRMNTERYQERARWRKQKQAQQMKKNEAVIDPSPILGVPQLVPERSAEIENQNHESLRIPKSEKTPT